MFLLLVACDPATPGGIDAEVQPDAFDAQPVDAQPLDAQPLDAQPDAAPPVELRLNEIDCRHPDRVELVNLGGAGLLAGYVLADEADHRVALEGEAAPRITPALSFPIYCGVTRVTLRDPEGQIIDEVAVPLLAASDTWGRLPDGEGAWAANAPSPDAANEAPARPSTTLFDAQVHRVELVVGEFEREVLERDPNRLQGATLRVDEGDALAVGVRVIGRSGRWHRFDQKPSLGLRFDPDSPPSPRGRRFGLAGLELHAGPLDPSAMRRWLGAELLRQAGLSTPQIGFARLTVNGEDYGLYRMAEPLDALFFSRHHPSTWAAYTTDGGDFVAEDLGRFRTLAGGSGSLHPVLDALAAALSGEAGYVEAERFLDWPQVLRALAAEAWLRSGDGYGPTRRHLTVHFDALNRGRLYPGALDQVFLGAQSPYLAGGLLLRRCFESAECQGAYEAALVAVSEALSAPDLAGFDAWVALLRPEVASDPRHIWSVEMFDAEAAILRAAVVDRAAEMAAEAACLRGAEDADGDGWRCMADCAPEDPEQHQGAVDLCDDGLDQDCDGQADNGPDCADCVAASRGAHGYLLCPQGRTWPEARAICQQQGMDLARVDSASENHWLFGRARQVRVQSWWLGINDREHEGRFVWADGAEPSWTHWGDGEPNDWGTGEDCGHFRGDGAWNDIPCDHLMGFICEAPCDPVDQDDDGALSCGMDCDDDDATVAPGLEEICGDDLDQDCSGRADDAPECGACTEVEGPTGRYLFCADGVPFEAAVARCVELDAHLVIIDSAEESQWLWDTAMGVAGQRWWMGLSDAEHEQDWRWVDGGRLTWADWSRGQPDDAGHREHCVHFWEDRPQWNDVPCDAEYGVICERQSSAKINPSRDD